MPADFEPGLDKPTIAAIVERMPDGELKDALRVVQRHLSEHCSEERSVAEWSVYEDNDLEIDLIFGISKR